MHDSVTVRRLSGLQVAAGRACSICSAAATSDAAPARPSRARRSHRGDSHLETHAAELGATQLDGAAPRDGVTFYGGEPECATGARAIELLLARAASVVLDDHH